MKRVLSTGDVNDASLIDVGLGSAFTQVTSKRRRSKKSNLTQTQNRSKDSASHVDDVINAVGSHSGDLQNSPSCDPSSPRTRAASDSVSELEEMKNTIRSQQLVIDKLSAQLSFVLSFLDISDTDSVTNTATVDSQAASYVNAVAGDVSIGSVAVTTGANVAIRMDNVVSSDDPSRQRSGASGLRDLISTAICTDQRSKERRAKSVIVTGLASCSDSRDTDLDLVRQLFAVELDLNTTPKYCKRLGQAADGRIQPVLVMFSSTDHANEVLSRAKLLRKSKQEFVRDNVYINRNLTKVEARLAYEERCRRRELQQQRQSQRRNDSNSRRDRAVAQHTQQEAHRPTAGRVFTRSASATVVDNYSAAVNTRTTSLTSSPSNSSIPVIIGRQGSLATTTVSTASLSTVPTSWSSIPSVGEQASSSATSAAVSVDPAIIDTTASTTAVSD